MTPSRTHQTSTRLRADVAVYAAGAGHVLRVGREHHHVHLDAPDADDLLDALVDGGAPVSARAGAALDALVAAALVDVPPVRHTVGGGGLLAAALGDALARMGAAPVAGGVPVLALDGELPDRSDRSDPSDPLNPSTDERAAAVVCWVQAGRVVLAPPGVPAADVAARHRAATRHRGTDRRTAPVPGGRVVTAATPALPAAGLEVAAAVVAGRLLLPDRPAHEAVTVDLHTHEVRRHPVLPVPVPPA